MDGLLLGRSGGLNSEQKDEECDATDDDSSTKAGNKKSETIKEPL
jgi:hypothetical protein